MDNGDFFRFQDAKLKFNDRREDNLLIKVKDKGRMNSKEKYEGRQYSFLVQIGGRRRLQYMKILLNIIIFQGSSCTGSMITEGSLILNFRTAIHGYFNYLRLGYHRSSLY